MMGLCNKLLLGVIGGRGLEDGQVRNIQSHVAVFEEKGKSRQRRAKIMSIAHEAGET